MLAFPGGSDDCRGDDGGIWRCGAAGEGGLGGREVGWTVMSMGWVGARASDSPVKHLVLLLLFLASIIYYILNSGTF